MLLKRLDVLIGLWFFQVNYWNSNVNEVQGVVMDQEGKVVHRLFGKWHEGLYCGVAPSAKCIWRPGEMGVSLLRLEGILSNRRKGMPHLVQFTICFHSEIKNIDA